VRQLDAIALAAKQSGTTPWVMAPMVATVEGAQVFADQVRERGLRAGVMVEVPGSALLAHRFLEVVDFLSIGTNDLTQYTMAADRMASDLAHLTAADSLLAMAPVGMWVTSRCRWRPPPYARRRLSSPRSPWTCVGRQPRRLWRRPTRPPDATPSRPPHLTPPIRPGRLRGDRTQFCGRIGWGVVSDGDSRGQDGDSRGEAGDGNR